MSYPRRNAVTQRFTLGAPRTFSVSRDGQHILFCRSTAGDDPVNRLWVIDLPNTEPRLLVDPVELLGSGDIELTAAEKARRERAREAGGGIVTYTTHSEHGIVVFALNGSLYQTTIETGETTEVDTLGGAFDPRISPDGKLIAYYASAQLRVTGEGGDRLVAGEATPDPAIKWGAAEFIAAEEMGRSRGFWWGPESDRFLVARVNTADVTSGTSLNPSTPQSFLEHSPTLRPAPRMQPSIFSSRDSTEVKFRSIGAKVSSSTSPAPTGLDATASGSPCSLGTRNQP